MTDHPYCDVRRALVEGIRNNPEKSDELKRHAEILIVTIDGIHKEGENDDNRRAFQEGYARFVAAAEGQPFPEKLSPEEIAKALGRAE